MRKIINLIPPAPQNQIIPKYITEEDEQGRQEVKIASLYFRPIHKCIAGPELLAQIVLDKFVYHLTILS